MHIVQGSSLLRGAVDCHIHACPHLNARSVTVFEAVRQAAAAGMCAIGLMDNFANSAGLAALAMTELGDLGVEVFGGIMLELPAGGISPENVKIALDLGYGPGTGARFVALPVHHTRHTARLENRSELYIESCFHVPLSGPIADELKEILDIVASRDVVFNTGEISGDEAIRICQEAQARGIRRILSPCNYFSVDQVAEITSLGAYAEFSFLCMSHATAVPDTSIDSEAHAPPPVRLADAHNLIRAATPERTVLSSDSGTYLLPPPAEALRGFLVQVQSGGFSDEQMRTMSSTNPRALFKVGGGH